MSFRLKRYIKRNFDELAIAGTIARVLAQREELDADDELIVEAFRRSTPELATADVEQIREYLERFDETQLTGVASNIKGITHEIRYVELENEDGDSLSAVLFDSPTHPGTDVVLSDDKTGDTWALQLKATDEATGVREWIDAHPDGHIQVTSELADRLGIDSSGMSNEELTAEVDTFIDKAFEDPDLWDYFPHLTVVSMAIVLFTLFRRYKQGALSSSEFRLAAVSATGWKVAKIALLLTLLSIPVVNVITGAAMVARLIISGREVLVRNQSPDMEQFSRTGRLIGR